MPVWWTIIILYKQIRIMSSLHHEEILFNLYEECLEMIEKAGLDPNSDSAHEVAIIRANQMFEEQCQ
tara:strand:+ start:1372 stop:1572 length:201 start_codon:yes stop_codon:yes gene_type:complete